jgi:hypothetical protein
VHGFLSPRITFRRRFDAQDVPCLIVFGCNARISGSGIIEHQKPVYNEIVYSIWHVLLTISNFQFSNIIKNNIHLTVSGLGAMTGTTGRVFPLILHPISCKSDGYGFIFEG